LTIADGEAATLDEVREQLNASPEVLTIAQGETSSPCSTVSPEIAHWRSHGC
jgi:hypothetical protein